MSLDERKIETLIARARDTKDGPTYTSDSEVRVLGEALAEPVYWTGREWAVTSFGIEARSGQYPIAKNCLWEEEDTYGWVRHMDEKGWVDMPDFVEALRLARKRWPRE